MESGSVVFGLIVFTLGVIAYIFPLALASHRKCEAAAGIAVVNIFLGWTFIGWVVALAWAASGKVRTA
jgi:hypothetical protein